MKLVMIVWFDKDGRSPLQALNIHEVNGGLCDSAASNIARTGLKGLVEEDIYLDVVW